MDDTDSNAKAPEEAPLRMSPELELRIDAYAERHGIPLLMAQKCLIAAGLNAEERQEQLHRARSMRRRAVAASPPP